MAISANIFHYYHYQSFKNVLPYNLFFYIYDAPDSPHNQRPQFIIMGKESTEIIAEDIKRVDRERQALRQGFTLRESGVSCSVESNVTMIEAKMRKTLSGLGGAFCLLCHADKDTASGRGVDEPEDYFTITRTGVEIKRKFDDLEKKRDGSVMTTRGDYKDRLGVTQPPIMQDTNALETLVFVSPLHALMRSFGLAILLLYHLSCTLQWTESKRKLGRSHQLFTIGREEAKAAVRDVTGIIMDAVDFAGHGGSTD